MEEDILREYGDDYGDDGEDMAVLLQHLGGQGFLEESLQEPKKEKLDLASLEREAMEYFARKRAESYSDGERHGVAFSEEFLRRTAYEEYADPVGPWSETLRVYGYEYREHPVFGSIRVWALIDIVEIEGYEGVSDTLSDLPERMDQEFDSWSKDQEEMFQLEKDVDSALLHEEVESSREKREEFYHRLLRWLATASRQDVAQNARRFWAKLNASRAECARSGKWYQVCLTKSQANMINVIIRQRAGWKVE